MDLINRKKKSVIGPSCERFEKALLNLHTHVVNADLFSQQEN